jgi:ubiquinone/menaquinone biosynthesis C-methylase UbiE
LAALAAAPIEGDIVVRRRGRLAGLFGATPPGAVLDVPAGGAVQSRALANLGYRVFSIDLFAPEKRVPDTSWICADANRALPFRDAAFDYVLSREGIEHLEDQMGFLRSCARVLRPGGMIVLTTPNMMHLAARASGFLTGQRNLRRGLVNEIQTPRGQKDGPPYHGHVFMLDYYRARYMMRLAGFERIEVCTDRWSPTSVAMAPIVPILWIAMKFSVAASARNARRPGHRAPPKDVMREIIGHVLSPPLLFGKRMIIVAEKSNR